MELSQVQPLMDRILVRRESPEGVSRGGVIIPDTAQKRPREGTVIAVGPGRRLDDGTILPVSVEEGDKVLFPDYAFQPIEIEGDEFIVIQEQDVLGTIID